MPLHKVGQGLLELFRLRTLGRNPDEFGTTVVPTTDVTDFYGVDLLTNVSQVGAAGGIGAGIAATQSQFARRYSAISGTLTIGAAAGAYLNIALGYALPGAATQVFIESLQLVPVIGGTYRVAAGDAARGLILPPGHTLVFVVNGNAGGADHVPEIQYSFQVLDGR